MSHHARTFPGLGLLLAATLLVANVSRPASADFAAGERAYVLGDFQRAIEEFQPLVEQGDAAAEMMTGLMYLRGDGYPRNEAIAAVWLYKAASKNEHSAQLVFGSQRLYGQGIRQNLVDAYMWLTLAGKSDNAGVVQQAKVFREVAEGLMSEESLATARTRAASFRPWRDGFVGDN